MSVFKQYARYYDLLYKDKDYPGEAAYIRKLVEKHAPGAKSILELGCGTGKHARLLSAMGYAMTGVDMSADMLAEARSRSGQDGSSAIAFHEGDIRTFRLAEKFDVVVSLFHVISYQVTDADMRAALWTAREHLKPGGVFIFDVWYGPAVLTQIPSPRVKRLENAAIKVTRIAEPVLRADENRVDVNYNVFITDKASGKVDELNETHHMRYLFRSELGLFLGEAGMRIDGEEEWMTGNRPGTGTWGVCFVASVAVTG